MIVEKIKEFLEKENKRLTDGFKFLIKQEYSQLTGFNFERQFLSDREISSGDFDENDIVRLEDKYGRA